MLVLDIVGLIYQLCYDAYYDYSLLLPYSPNQILFYTSGPLLNPPSVSWTKDPFNDCILFWSIYHGEIMWHINDLYLAYCELLYIISSDVNDCWLCRVSLLLLSQTVTMQSLNICFMLVIIVGRFQFHSSERVSFLNCTSRTSTRTKLVSFSYVHRISFLDWIGRTSTRT